MNKGARPVAAYLMPLEDLQLEKDVGIKVRVVGFLTSYDPKTSLCVVSHNTASLLVDISMILVGKTFLPRMRSKVMCIGEISRRTPSDLPLSLSEPTETQPFHQPEVDSNYVLPAIILNQVDDLDLDEWCTAARESSEMMWEERKAKETSRDKRDMDKAR